MSYKYALYTVCTFYIYKKWPYVPRVGGASHVDRSGPFLCSANPCCLLKLIEVSDHFKNNKNNKNVIRLKFTWLKKKEKPGWLWCFNYFFNPGNESVLPGNDWATSAENWLLNPTQITSRVHQVPAQAHVVSSDFIIGFLTIGERGFL